MKTKTFHKKLLPISIALIMATPVVAQEEDASEKKSSKNSDIELIIVTGTAGGAGISRLDASYSITTMDPSEIEQFAPKSTADLFKAIPGVWVESSGGVSGANIQVRGIPAAGDAPLVTIALNGAPVYGAPSLSFFESSTIFRLDETIGGVEALRGGPNPVFASGQNGLTVNFRLKKGNDDIDNRIKYTISDFGLNRVDAVFGGDLGNDLYYMIGGYVSSSPGLRDSEFTSERGKQLTINLTKEFETGEVSIFSRTTDDTGAFYTAIPVGEDGKGIPGFDPRTDTLQSNDIRFASIATNFNADTGDTDYKTYDLADGRGWDGVVSGLNANFDLSNGWSVRNNLSVTEGDANTIALFNGDVGTIENLTSDGATGTVISSGEALTSDAIIAQAGFWAVEKHFKSISNDLSFSLETDDHKFSVGLYTDSFSSDDVWSLGNNFYLTAENNAQRVDVVDADDNALSQNGQYSGAFFSLKQSGTASTRALYLTDAYKVNDEVTVDAGARFINYNVNMTFDFPIEAPVNDIYTTQVLDGVTDRTENHDVNDIAYTIGANWNFADNQGVFVRLNSGILLPTFETVRNTASQATGQDPADQTLEQLEIGYKLITESTSFYATVFSSEFSAAQQQITGDQIIVTTTESETLGVELDGNYYHDSGLMLGFNVTWQDAEFTASNDETLIGNTPQRIPELQFRFNPSYEFDLGDSFMTVYGSVRWVDDRFSNNANNQDLPSFTKVDLGANWTVTDELSFLFSVDNAFDEIGFTEGNARTAGAQTNVQTARPIFGRSMNLSVAYSF
jgi:iron complex outermembrane receptor protein